MSVRSWIRIVALAPILAWGADTAGGTVRLDPATPLAESLRSIALAHARERVAAPDRFEVLSYRSTGSAPVERGTVRVTLVSAGGPNGSGIVQLRLRLDAGPAGATEAHASVRGLVRGPALVARRTLARSEPIADGAVERVETDLTRLGAPPLRDPGELAGRVARRTIGAGRVLSGELLMPAPLVRRGGFADLTVDRKGVVVTLRARVEQDGALGELVPVRNPASGARMLGRVRADGSLSLERGPQAQGGRP